jgi:hypothetical protein
MMWLWALLKPAPRIFRTVGERRATSGGASTRIAARIEPLPE